MTVVSNGKRFLPVAFNSERDFEEDIASASKTLFGQATIFINAKKKIESRSLGTTVPDGFFFDFSDPDDPQFYIVEVELTKHSFYSHIFPQITKFFAFFRNQRLQKDLVDKLYSLIDTDASLNSEFKRFLGKQEIYKFLSDLIDSSQNILLVCDDPIRELAEIFETYTDTWGRTVKFMEIHKYLLGEDVVYTIAPDFETIQYLEPPQEPTVEEEPEEVPSYTEEFHLSDVAQNVRDIYGRIKELALSTDPSLRFNPQKYYISIKSKRNIAFLKIRKKKVRFIAMMPENEIRAILSKLPVSTLSEAVQRFYNGPCAAVDILDLSNENDLKYLIAKVVEWNKNV